MCIFCCDVNHVIIVCYIIYVWQVSKTEVVLTVSKCKRSDTGKYKVQLTNSSGTTEVAVKATVLGK